MITKKELNTLLQIFNTPKTKEERKQRLINSGIINSKGELNKNYYVE